MILLSVDEGSMVVTAIFFNEREWHNLLKEKGNEEGYVLKAGEGKK